jgi:hypothetical protein
MIKVNAAACRAPRMARRLGLGLCLLSALCLGLPAQKADDFSLEPRPLAEAVKRIVTKLDEAIAGKGSRLAVATFARSGAVQGQDNRFGEYFSDLLQSAVRTMIPRARLYERKRIDVILKEQAFDLSDIVDQEKAKAIGDIAPVDEILTGSYTVFDSYIDSSCVLVDVSSGLILFNRTERIALDQSLAGFVGAPGASSGQAAKPGPSRADALRALLGDLSTPEKVAAVVRAAVAIPFDSGEGKVHYEVISAFRRYGIRDEGYRRFLLGQMANIQFPSDDDRCYSILSFLTSPPPVDEELWKAGLAAVAKSRVSAIPSLLAMLLSSNDDKGRDEAFYARDFARMDEFLGLVAKKAVGLPVPIDQEAAFVALTDAWRYGYTTDNRPLRRVIDSCAPAWSKPSGKARERYYSLLGAMYPRETDPKAKREFLNMLADYFNSGERTEALAVSYFAFVRGFEVTDYKKRNPEELAKYPTADLGPFVERTRATAALLAPMTQFRSQKEERIDFCVANGIEVPGFVPTVKESLAQLAAPEWYDRLRAVRVLGLMGTKPAGTEAALLRAYEDDEDARDVDLHIFRAGILTVLGNIKTKNPAALELLLSALSDVEYEIHDAAADALLKIGEPALPYLIRGLSSDNDSLQYSCAQILGKMGPPAKAALPALKKLSSKATYSKLKEVVDKAIRQIQG